MFRSCFFRFVFEKPQKPHLKNHTSFFRQGRLAPKHPCENLDFGCRVWFFRSDTPKTTPQKPHLMFSVTSGKAELPPEIRVENWISGVGCGFFLGRKKESLEITVAPNYVERQPDFCGGPGDLWLHPPAEKRTPLAK